MGQSSPSSLFTLLKVILFSEIKFPPWVFSLFLCGTFEHIYPSGLSVYIKHDEYGLDRGTGDHIGVLHLLLLKLLLLLFTTTPIWKGGSGDHIGVVHLLLLGNGVVKIILECGEYSTFPTNIRNRESFPDHLLFHIKNIIINTERRKLYKCIFDQLNGSIFQRLTRSSSRLG